MKKPKKKKQKPSSGGTEQVTRSQTTGVAPGSSGGAAVMEKPLLLPEGAEPMVSALAFPLALVVVMAVLFYGADMYLMNHSGSFSPLVYYPNTEEPTGTSGPNGKRIFDANCAACHQPTGLGNSAMGWPPLAGSDWVQMEGPNRLIRVVLNGLSGPIVVNGQPFNNTMVPWRETMSDAEIAAVLTYIRSSWGNQAPPVKPEKVTEIRKATEGRSSNWTEEELKAVPPAD